MGDMGFWKVHSLIQKGPSEGSGFFQLRNARRQVGRLLRLALLQIRNPQDDRLVVTENLLLKLNTRVWLIRLRFLLI